MADSKPTELQEKPAPKTKPKTKPATTKDNQVKVGNIVKVTR